MIKKIFNTIKGFTKETWDANFFIKVSRRFFLKILSVAAAGLFLPALNSCSRGNNTAASQVFPENPGDDDPPPGIGTVSVVRNTDIDSMVSTAIDLAGGINEIRSGQTVLIKPNITGMGSSEYECRFCTNPEVLRSVIKIVKARTAADNITVADACAYDYSTIQAAQYWGLYDVCIQEGVNFQSWEPSAGGQYVEFTNPKIKYLYQPVLIPQNLSTFDHFINLPILKNHRNFGSFNAVFTSCLKNFVGILNPYYRLGSVNAQTNIHNANIGRYIAEIGLCVPKITMNIVDATLVVLAGGPAQTVSGGGMKYAEPNLIIASKDRVACDTVGIAVLKAYAGYQGIAPAEVNYFDLSVFDYDQIKRGCEIGLGRRDPNFINVVFDNVDNETDIIENWV